MNVTAPLAVSVIYSSGVMPLSDAALRVEEDALRTSVSGVTPEGADTESVIVMGAARAAGGTSIVPEKLLTDGSGAVVAVATGRNELFD